jgi:Reverse transcriptase (RNA-dependent DNA polymerase)/RNase H-like domain found in reverse transcriptase
LFRRLEGFDYMTSLDLTLAFYHIGLSPRSKEVCTMVVPWGLYEYDRLPQGLSLSADVLMARMQALLGHLPFVLVYFDDILIFTKGSVAQHIFHINNVLQRLSRAKLHINLEKSHFFASKVKYLGFILSREGIRSDPEKVSAIKNIAIPKTRKQLRSFIGLCSFIRETINRYSDRMAPLTDLLSTKKAFKWTNDHTLAFKAVQTAVINSTMLSFPDYTRPFEIFCDASNVQLGAIVAQKTSDVQTGGPERFKPIAFFVAPVSSVPHHFHHQYLS